MTIKKTAAAALMAALLCIVAFPGVRAEEPSAYTNRGIELGKEKRYDDALREFDKAMKLHDKASARTLHNIAFINELMGKVDEAIRLYEETIRRSPRQTQSYERLGYLYYITGNYTRAVELGEYVIKRLDPNNPRVVEWLPEAYKLKLKKNLESPPQKKEAGGKGQTLGDIGKSEKAKKKEDTSKMLVLDVIGKLGYVPQYHTAFEEYQGINFPDKEQSGLAFQVETNFYIKGFWPGIGLEYQYLSTRYLYPGDKDLQGKNFGYHYIAPILSLKYLTGFGVYGGIAFSGKYLISSTDKIETVGVTYKPKTAIDFWTHLVFGYYYQLNETISLCVENRFGYNVTGRQFSQYSDNFSGKVKTDLSWEYAVFFGAGTRIYFTPPKEAQ